MLCVLHMVSNLHTNEAWLFWIDWSLIFLEIMTIIRLVVLWFYAKKEWQQTCNNLEETLCREGTERAFAEAMARKIENLDENDYSNTFDSEILKKSFSLEIMKNLAEQV